MWPYRATKPQWVNEDTLYIKAWMRSKWLPFWDYLNVIKQMFVTRIRIPLESVPEGPIDKKSATSSLNCQYILVDEE